MHGLENANKGICSKVAQFRILVALLPWALSRSAAGKLVSKIGVLAAVIHQVKTGSVTPPFQMIRFHSNERERKKEGEGGKD